MTLPCRSAGLSQNPRGPYADVVAAAEIRLHQAINHKGRRHVDAVLAGVFAMPFDLVLQLGAGKRRGQRDAGVAVETAHKLPGGGGHIWAASTGSFTHSAPPAERGGGVAGGGAA